MKTQLLRDFVVDRVSSRHSEFFHLEFSWVLRNPDVYDVGTRIDKIGMLERTRAH